jgi:hypothetical protein
MHLLMHGHGASMALVARFGARLGKLRREFLDVALLITKLRPKLLGVGLLAADRHFRCGKGGLGIGHLALRLRRVARVELAPARVGIV